ncbi:hypothetical protein TCON_0430 [Astathelohania contejeani]|uniref:Uncharacterized protein n=1 Tax=Astathelohania contejeani TaxID=164912 RepID=A0ABQ7I1S3_9MICR|nr:hypothetical protein TCON_0430 [Thelohania contejeani]
MTYLRMNWLCYTNRIISYVMTWDGVVTKYHRNYLKELNIIFTIEAYIKSTELKKTLETMSLKYRKSIEDKINVRDRVEEAVKRFEEASTTRCQLQAIENE